MENGKKANRKFLKTIYSIQRAFDVLFGSTSITFPYIGIFPESEEEKRLNVWFEEVTAAKKKLYNEIYADYSRMPSKYLSKKFDYKTFFEGGKILTVLKQNDYINTYFPVGEGLLQEINGSVNSFITNHQKIFTKNQEVSRENLDIITDNELILQEHDIKPPDSSDLLNLLTKLINSNYGDYIAETKNLKQLNEVIERIRDEIREYNYEINQICNKNKDLSEDLEILSRISLLPSFPNKGKKEILSEDEKTQRIKELLGNLLDISQKSVGKESLKSFFESQKKKSERIREHQRKRFETRVIAYLNRRLKNNEVRKYEEFLNILDKKILQLQKHFAFRPTDNQNRNRYFELLALKARLASPEIEKKINRLLSTLKGMYYAGRKEKEIITLPGFSWNKKEKGKPNKNVALAFENKQLNICISTTQKSFITGDNGDMLFIKTVGGQRRRKNAQKKKIIFVKGKFLKDGQENLPLLLQLHFGKSYARRFFFNKTWGVFSDTPKIFLNNARLKRERENPSDPWRYFLDITLSGEEVKGFKNFSRPILQKAETVIGIDRGEVVPIAFSVVRIKDGKTLNKGLLARQYSERLIKYFNRKRDYQSKGKTIPRYLNSKLSRLQKTLLETSSSEILGLVGKYKALMAIENLGRGFRGREEKIIPKKTYGKVEQLLASALQLAGLLKINDDIRYQRYWGALLPPVNPAGTSQTCLGCKITWNKTLLSSIDRFLLEKQLNNIDFSNLSISLSGFCEWLEEKITHEEKKMKNKKGKLYKESRNIKVQKKIAASFRTRKLLFSSKFEIYNNKNKHNEEKTTADIKLAIKNHKYKNAVWLLRYAIGPRIKRDTFVCPNCGFKENADIVGSTNVGIRGIETIKKFLTLKN